MFSRDGISWVKGDAGFVDFPLEMQTQWHSFCSLGTEINGSLNPTVENQDKITALYSCATSNGQNCLVAGSENNSICQTANGKANDIWHSDISIGTLTFCINPLGCTPPSIQTPPPAKYNSYGWLDQADCNLIRGWTWDQDSPNVGIWIHLYQDGPAGTGIKVGSVLANLSRPDLIPITKDNGYHGFSLSTPAAVKDSRTHSIYVHGINTDGTAYNNLLLNGSPKSITCAP